MPNTTTTAAAVRAAKDDLRAAETRLRELAEERNRIDRDLQEASVLAARQKAEAARAGDPVVAPADLDALHLRQRRDELPYDLHAQEIYVEERKLAVHDAVDVHRQARYEEAEAVFAEIAPRFEALKQEYEEAQAARINPERGVHASRLRKIDQETLAQLEANPPALGEEHSPGATSKRIVARSV